MYITLKTLLEEPEALFLHQWYPNCYAQWSMKYEMPDCADHRSTGPRFPLREPVFCKQFTQFHQH